MALSLKWLFAFHRKRTLLCISIGLPSAQLSGVCFARLLKLESSRSFGIIASQVKASVFNVLCAVLLLFVCGCSRNKIGDDYGESYGEKATKSPAGYSALRGFVDDAGFRTTSLNGITRSTEKLDVIVWAPDSFSPHELETVRWFGEWLSKGDKTLVYIGRDYPAYADVMSKVAGAKNGLIEDWDHAKLQDAGLNPTQSSISDPVFRAGLLASLDEIMLESEKQSSKDIIALPWGVHDLRETKWRTPSVLGGTWGGKGNQGQHRIIYRSTLKSPLHFDVEARKVVDDTLSELEQKKEERRRVVVSESVSSENKSSNGVQTAPTPTKSNVAPVDSNESIYDDTQYEEESSSSDSIEPDGAEDEILLDEELDKLTRVESFYQSFSGQTDNAPSNIDIEVLLSDVSGLHGDSLKALPLVTKIEGNMSGEEGNGGDGATGKSKIILVSTPALLSNYSLTHPGNVFFCRELIGEFHGRRVGFLTGERDPIIRLDRDELTKQKGIELFTEWPMSLISLHAAFAGAIVLFALYPILGRPRTLPVPSRADFSQHIVALGEMLMRSRDQRYARKTIAEYFRLVKRDLHSPWAQESTDDKHPDSKDK